jgi:diguanylate cyclase (GGDEF)-like protein
MVARRVWQKIQEVRIAVEGGVLRVTVSIGGVQYNPETMSEERELISVADQMMYEAKASGKNRVCMYQQTKRKHEDSKK